MNTLPSVVPGEAPESDDESQLDKLTRDNFSSSRSIVFGEAPESSSSSTSSSEFQDITKTTENLDETSETRDNATGTSCNQNTGTDTGKPTTASPSIDVREKVLRSIRAQRKDSLPSLLVTKLRENNISLRSSLVDLVRQTAVQTSKEIIAIDHDLLRSQMTLQEAVTSYRQMNKNVKEINAALLLSSSLNGIPKIDIRAVL